MTQPDGTLTTMPADHPAAGILVGRFRLVHWIGSGGTGDVWLAEDKRAKAEENINDVAEKLSTQWINGCRSSLVGKVVERERLKCALESKTMKTFEECISPPVEKK